MQVMPRVGKSSFINFGGAVVPIIVSLVSAPIYLDAIGAARYGVLAIVWVLLSYFGVFDLGLGRAVANHVARMRAATPSDISLVVWTALGVNIGLGVVGGAVLLLLGNVLLGQVFTMPPELRSEAIGALPWVAGALPSMTGASVVIGALEGRERFLSVNVVGTIGTLLVQLSPLGVALWHGSALTWLIAAAVLARWLSVGLALIVASRAIPLVGPPRLRSSLVRPLLRYGGWMTVTALVSPLLTSLGSVW